MNNTMAMIIETEKRRYIRYELLDCAVLELEDWDGLDDNSGEPLAVVVTDIGLGGLQIRARQLVPTGTPCTVRIATESGREHRLPAEVRHGAAVPKTDLVAVGLRFTPRTHEERIAVAEFVHLIFRRQSEGLD